MDGVRHRIKMVSNMYQLDGKISINTVKNLVSPICWGKMTGVGLLGVVQTDTKIKN
ncbi:hypothetical protein [Clostridioides difficile]|uniref:hypothetical protein n=1 Tax=Clostridioides difficile TaxID=1496 RepID=UPI001C1B1BA0|nr:hypothetical protein [Clostridioides difficile]MBY1383111.1 hypothetical protein [Clostridioides difficile]MCR1683208.1 hypothetical protein [Clostridioides difficile]HBE8439573.1 hypothetical protein [Clostridioides difficile]HBF8574911.1 hypothetical protein [Clostridioides difficile]HEL3002311.1 hypothetical protein [Clostridioides difficile]